MLSSEHGCYVSLSDPSGRIPLGTSVHWSAEPALGSIVGQSELDAVMDCLRESASRDVGFRAAKETELLECEFSRLCGGRDAVALNGGGSALDLALRALGVGEGDEVVTGGANFHGVHLAVMGTGARVVPVEIDSESWACDPKDLFDKLSVRTRAVILTSLHGSCAGIPEATEAVSRASVGPRPTVIVDAARALGSRWGGTPIGELGDVVIFSLQSKKILTAMGEGGVVATACPDVAEKLRRYRAFGDRSSWGSNFKMSKAQAVFAAVQLTRLSDLVQRRRDLMEERIRYLREWGIERHGVALPRQCDRDLSSGYLFPILLPRETSRSQRDRAMEVLTTRFGVQAVVANPPTYLYNSYISERLRERTPRSEDLFGRMFCTSLHPTLTSAENREIAGCIMGVLEEVM